MGNDLHYANKRNGYYVKPSHIQEMSTSRDVFHTANQCPLESHLKPLEGIFMIVYYSLTFHYSLQKVEKT